MANVATIEIRAQDKTTTAFRKVNSGLRGLDNRIDITKGKMGLLNGGLGKMVGIMGGVLGVAAVVNFSKNILEIGDRMHKVSGALGLTVPKLQAFQFAASQSGINTEIMHKALGKFNVEIGVAAGELPGVNTKFSDLGINIFDINGDLKDSPQLFADVSEKIAEMKEPTEKAAAAADLFGQKAGIDLLPLLVLGADGVKDFEKKLVASGAIISQDAAEDIAKFNDKIDIMQRTIRGKLAPVLVAILPALGYLAENIDAVALAVGVLAGAFVIAKIGAAIAGITTVVLALSAAFALSPLLVVGGLAAGITAIGTAAYTYSDNIAEFFGFGETAPEELEATDKKLKKLNKTVDKTIENEEAKVEIAEEFVKFNKKDIIPNLKKLEEGLGETKIKFVNLVGEEGLGGIQLAFRKFFMDVWADATFYLGGTSATIKKNFTNMKTDFEEFFKALDNIVIFEGQDVKNAFSSIMTNLEKQVKAIDISFDTTLIAVPDTIFDFTNTVVEVPGDIFGTAATAEAKLVSLVNKINSYSASSRTVGRLAVSANWQYYDGAAPPLSWDKPFWFGEHPSYSTANETNELKYDVPYISTGGGTQNAPSQMSSPASRNASRGGGGSGVVVNIYDGTGQKISAYDSEIRVQITERASRNSEFAALE